MAPDAGGDSLHVGVNDGTPDSAADLTGFAPNAWTWSRLTMSNTNATLDLTAGGVYTLNVHMREACAEQRRSNGLRLDKLLLTSDDTYTPGGQGPAESAITTTLPALSSHTISYSYDPLYRLTGASYSGAISADYAYTYDAVGNMTAYTETIGAETTTVTRTFNAANQLTSLLDSGSGEWAFTYDGNGNLIEQSPLDPFSAGRRDYVYDQRNLLTRVDFSSSICVPGFVSYIYDGDGDRVQQQSQATSCDDAPIETITYTNDVLGLTQVLAANDNATITYNLFGLDLIQQDAGADTRTLLADGLGSVRVEMVDETIETTNTYEPYGKVLAQSDSSSTVYGYTGEQHDSATGLVYLRARYYDPSLKVFLSRDPFPGWMELPASQHPYSYAHNNPVNLTDPSGETAVPIPAPPPPIVVPGIVVVGGGVFVGVVGYDLVVAPLLGRPPLTPMLMDVFGAMTSRTGAAVDDVLEQCRTIVETAFQQQTQEELAPRPQPTPPGLGPDISWPVPTPRSQHIFYFADVGSYPWPGRDTNQLVSYLSDYEGIIPGVEGVRSQLESAQRSYNRYGSNFGPRLMGRKFEAERLIFYADRAALGSANSTAKGVDLFPVNFGSIQFIQVKWSVDSMPLRTVQEVANTARRLPSGTYL